jgi:hypothetical protein
METSRVIIGLLFLVVGVVLFRGAMLIRLKMEKEVKGGRAVLWNSFLPYWNSKDFTERGNSLRKTYNIIYFVLIFYSLALIAFMKVGE